MRYNFITNNYTDAVSYQREIRMKIKNDGYATCRDFFKITGQYDPYGKGNFTDPQYNFYGWETLHGFDITKTEDGRWCLTTPEIKEI